MSYLSQYWNIPPECLALLPELTLLAGAFLFFLCSLFKSTNRNVLSFLAIVLALAVTGAAYLTLSTEMLLFEGAYAVDEYSQFFKLLLATCLPLLLIGGMHLKGINKDVLPEYYLFLWLSVLGLMMLVSSVELIAIFVSLELSSFALYLLVPLRDDSTGLRSQMEAGMKYILFGVMATGFMLYGMSYLFGLTGSTYLNEIIPTLTKLLATDPLQPAVFVALLMVLAAFFYKLAAFPMHFWVPDVYQGASNETAAFVATLPKFAAVAMLVRFLAIPTTFSPLLVQVLAVLALASMFYGNLCALVQKDIKRMLGFSGIAHAGFVVLALLALGTEGYSVAIYYITGYVLMNMACFLVIANVSQQGENLVISDFNGLYQREPILALTMGVALFALAGIPPFVGFMSKFMVMTSALRADHLLVVCLATINTAIAIYYYLSVVKAVYTVEDEDKPPVQVNVLIQCTGLILILGIIVMGVLPGKITGFTAALVQSLR